MEKKDIVLELGNQKFNIGEKLYVFDKLNRGPIRSGILQFSEPLLYKHPNVYIKRILIKKEDEEFGVYTGYYVFNIIPNKDNFDKKSLFIAKSYREALLAKIRYFPLNKDEYNNLLQFLK